MAKRNGGDDTRGGLLQRLMPKRRGDSGGAATPGRLRQLLTAAQMVHKADRKTMPLVAAAGVAVVVAGVVVGLLIGRAVTTIPLGVIVGLSVSMFLFGRYAQSAQYATIEGQVGAAAAVLQSMRGNWTVTPAISANRNMDVVHRAVGRPGVVLVGEGSPTRLPNLLAAEKKRVARVAYDVPVHDFQVGTAKGQLPISQLQRKVTRLSKQLSGPAVADLNFRLKALPATMQAPKGPTPRNARQPRMPKPRMR